MKLVAFEVVERGAHFRVALSEEGALVVQLPRDGEWATLARWDRFEQRSEVPDHVSRQVLQSMSELERPPGVDVAWLQEMLEELL